MPPPSRPVKVRRDGCVAARAKSAAQLLGTAASTASGATVEVRSPAATVPNSSALRPPTTDSSPAAASIVAAPRPMPEPPPTIAHRRHVSRRRPRLDRLRSLSFSSGVRLRRPGGRALGGAMSGARLRHRKDNIPDRTAVALNATSRRSAARPPSPPRRLVGRGHAAAVELHPVEVIEADQRQIVRNVERSAPIACIAPVDIASSAVKSAVGGRGASSDRALRRGRRRRNRRRRGGSSPRR